MALNKITYEDKVSLNPQPSVANKNKVSDADMNEIKAVVNQVVEDTGWVDLSSYVNTTNFTIREGFKPMARRIGNVVYLKGALYCTTAPGSQRANLLTDIPSQFRPPEEIAGAGMKYSLATPYRIWFEEGNILVQEAANIPVAQYYQGYYLSSLGCYLVD